MDRIDPEGLDFTLDELEEVENLIEAPASQWDSVSQAKMMKAMVYVVRKRTDPKVKLADIGKMRVSELQAELAPFDDAGTAAT